MVFGKATSKHILLYRVGNMETGNICRVIFWLAVVALTTGSKEDECRKELVFERLVELEYKVKEMNRELEKTNAGFLQDLDALNRRIDETSPPEGVKLVAFSSYNPVNEKPTTGSTIVFGSTQVNEGSAYSTTTGEFTVPDDGLYEFNANICNGDSKYIVYAINRNGNETLALSTQWDDTGSCGSVNALALCKAGETVSLKCDYCETGFQFYENVHHRNTFSGVRLH